jgi:hypothetical protein
MIIACCYRSAINGPRFSSYRIAQNRIEFLTHDDNFE